MNSEEDSDTDWNCTICSYINKKNGQKCEMCNTERPNKSLEKLYALQSQTEWQCLKCNYLNNGNKIACGKCKAIGTWCLESAVEQHIALTEDPNFPGGVAGAASDCRPNPDGVSSITSQLETLSFGSSNPEATPCTSVKASDLTETASPGDLEDELRIVLLGRTGEGKSATGNTILGVDEFESTISSISVTKGCQRGTCTRFGRFIQVIDTPGMYDTEMSVPEISREVIKCVGMTAPGPHAFLLVFKPDRFTEEVQNTIDRYVTLFGDGIVNHLIILFTRKDDLIYSGKTIEDYLERDSGKIMDLLVCCNYRYVAFNNRGTTEEQEEDVGNLLSLIDEMVQDNRGVYTNEMFQQAERIMREKEESLRRQHEAELEIQVSHIKEMCNQRLRTQKENYEDITAQLQKRLQEFEENGASCEDSAEIRKQLEDLKAEHKKKLKEIREMEGSERERLIMRKRNVNYRERARKDFFKDTLVPGLLEIGKVVLPLLVELGIAIAKRS